MILAPAERSNMKNLFQGHLWMHSIRRGKPDSWKIFNPLTQTQVNSNIPWPSERDFLEILNKQVLKS